MMDFLVYDAKVAVLIAMFYMFYRLLLQRDNLHVLNRIVLLGTAVLSFVLPLCVITLHQTKIVSSELMASVSVGEPMTAGIIEENAETPWWGIVLAVVFALGVIITLTYTIVSISKVCILIRGCEKHPQDDGTIIAVAEGEISPFSWMRYIVLSRSDYENPCSAIMMHERGHIKRYHSLDVVLVDILTSFQWFNPAMWMLRSDIRDIHEYEADAAVLSQGINVRQYQYLLIRKAMVAGGYSVANGINHSTLKQRIAMMQNKKENRYSWLKALYVLPIVAISLVATARNVIDYQLADSNQKRVTKVTTQKKKTVSAKATVAKKDVPVASEAVKEEIVIDDEPKVFDVVEQMPQYPGGTPELFKYFSQNVKYPISAQNVGASGRVVVQFIVNKDGSVSDVHTVYTNMSRQETEKTDGQPETQDKAKPTEEEIAAAKADLVKEAERVVSLMPKWTPGTQNGEAVRVKYNVPISFNLK